MLTVNGAHHPRCVSRDDVTPTFFDHPVSVRCSYARPRGLNSSPIPLVGAVAGPDSPRRGGRRVIGSNIVKNQCGVYGYGGGVHCIIILYCTHRPLNPHHITTRGINWQPQTGNMNPARPTNKRETIDPPRNTISQEIKQHRKEKTT